jgi:alpha-mannosidase
MKKAIQLACLFGLFSDICTGQLNVPYFGSVKWINGYAKEIAGENIGYFSAYPDYATTALLTRCTDGKKVIEWVTAPVPKEVNGKYVYFSWVAAHSSGTSKGQRHFDLYVNDEKLLTFTTFPANEMPVWTYGANDSSRIVFERTKTDAANDAHGLAFLRLPISRVSPGQPVKLKVVGQAEGSNDWYMTFKFSFEEKVDVTPMPFLLKSGKQTLLLSALHFGKDEQLQVKVNQANSFVLTVKNGMNSFDIPVDAVKKTSIIDVDVKIGESGSFSKEVMLKPVVYREIYFIHHSHTDIGYSHLQPEVLRIHMKNIDDALKMIEATKNYPEGSKFKWNIESLWVVENYLAQASSSQKDRFIKAVKEGSICLSGLYANILTGISEPGEVFHYTDYAEQLRTKYGFTIKSAMISDIPGCAWTTVTGLAQGGIRYFSSGPNYLGETHPYLGDRVGGFVRTWGDKPVWWSSPSGEEKILFWTAGKGYSSWHGTPAGGVFEKGPKKIAAYLNELTDSSYPYDIVQWRYNIVSDNGPLDTTISRFVEQWNRKYSSPKIVLSTTDQLFETFEKKYGSRTPTVKGDITPYWEDGAFSTAFEEGKNRVNSLRLEQLTTLFSILNPKLYNADEFYGAWKDILLFHEHTWGAYNSTSDPDLPFVTKQWEIKKQFMLDADSQINKLEAKLLNSFVDAGSKRIVVVNTTSWMRSGPVFIKSSSGSRSVKDEQGRKFPLQKLSDGRMVFMANGIPALGTKSFIITNEDADVTADVFRLSDNSVSNGLVNLGWDKEGSIVSLQENSSFNYVGKFSNQGLNSYWYVPGLDPLQASSTTGVNMKVVEKGPVLVTIEFTGAAPGTNGLRRRISLSAGSSLVTIENSINKKAVREKESVHFAFPFNESLTNARVDAGYGRINYLSDQLPGSNLDFLYGRRWLDVSNKDRGIQMILMEAPLVEPAHMIDERRTINASHKEWKTSGEATSTWFSYVMNNYWHTNYKADQGGNSSYHYVLSPHHGFDGVAAEKTAFEVCQPLMALQTAKETTGKPLFELTNNKLVVTTVTPGTGNSLIVRLFNPQTSTQQTDFLWGSVKPISVIDVHTKESVKGKNITLLPMSVTEIKLVY